MIGIRDGCHSTGKRIYGIIKHKNYGNYIGLFYIKWGIWRILTAISITNWKCSLRKIAWKHQYLPKRRIYLCHFMSDSQKGYLRKKGYLKGYLDARPSIKIRKQNIFQIFWEIFWWFPSKFRKEIPFHWLSFQSKAYKYTKK